MTPTPAFELHPKDTGATMIEFNHTEGAGPIDGPYWPAGPHWQSSVRRDTTVEMLAAEVDCADPVAFAARWATLFDRPVRSDPDGAPRIDFDFGALRFVHAARDEPVFAGLCLTVRDPAVVIAAAQARGLFASGSTVEICGPRMRLTGCIGKRCSLTGDGSASPRRRRRHARDHENGRQ
jgi:hypothetical protein